MNDKLRSKSKLKPNAIYIGDNGRSMCIDCAGATATLTLRDLSGQKLHKVTKADLDFWLEDMGEPWDCECGKVVLK